ncbi:hypothetical protein HAX54_029805, partial [Datura stramonium]|nr:hypothetical protein [Datura stramonium]
AFQIYGFIQLQKILSKPGNFFDLQKDDIVSFSMSNDIVLIGNHSTRYSLNWNRLFNLIDLSAPKHVLPQSMVQPGLAMEQACELGTPFRDLHRLDKEFQLMGRFFNWVIDLVNHL